MISKSLFKIIAICSFIIGAIIGVFPLIPALIGLAFFVVMFGIAPFMLIYLKKLNILKTIYTGCKHTYGGNCHAQSIGSLY